MNEKKLREIRDRMISEMQSKSVTSTGKNPSVSYYEMYQILEAILEDEGV